MKPKVGDLIREKSGGSDWTGAGFDVAIVLEIDQTHHLGERYWVLGNMGQREWLCTQFVEERCVIASENR
tara:strand:- start:51 stop:260 length:210 start_codon:yes stop_codon:yes gene_type:complete